MDYTRILKKGMSGDDVKYMKDCLFTLKYYNKKIKSIKTKVFGSYTQAAVKDFQSVNIDISGKALVVDGIIGKKTWDAIVLAYQNYDPSEKDYLKKYTWISQAKRAAINNDLQKVSQLRREIVLEILKYALDYDCKKEVRALYIIGANLYDTHLQLNYATAAKIEAAAKTHPDYFNNGRKAWMLAQVKLNPNLPASDCSGMEVGYLREHKLVSNTFDATANGLSGSSNSKEISKSALIPGDWVAKTGHIGTYVGGGYVVEFAGGEYGCQLTLLSKRKCYSFTRKSVRTLAGWTKYVRPKYY